MKVELFYFDGCPNWMVAHERLVEAVRATGRTDITVGRRRVETAAEAEAVGFTGSPTVRFDGRDPFATGSEQVGAGMPRLHNP